MMSRLATYFTAILLAILMMMSSGFDVFAESCDSETEIELAESISPISAQENVEQSKLIENKSEGENSTIIRKFNNSRIIDFNIIPVDRQTVFCSFRE